MSEETNDRPLNAYEEKQERRRQRLTARAGSKQAEGDRRYRSAKAIADQIPFGQPILVGHHSERRHRRDADKIHNGIGASIKLQQEADELLRRADSVGTGGISSDDPDALTKIQERIAELERTQDLMKQVNKLVRKEDRDGLAALGLSEAKVEALLTGEGDFMKRKGIPSYALTNNSANIRRLKERLTKIQSRAQAEATFEELTGDDWRIFAEDNRICIKFDRKPPQPTIDKLNSYGFHWSRNEGVWKLFFSNAAIWKAKQIVGLKDE